jgi:hypothetical protein
MGYKTAYLFNAAARAAISELLIPALQQAPGMLGSAMAKQRWAVHLYGLSCANPRESFCCVSPIGSAVDPFDQIGDGSLVPSSPVFLVPSRFEADHLAGVGIRPSSTAEPIGFADSWMAKEGELVINETDHTAGVALLRFQRHSDGMQFVGARTQAAAQAAAAQLAHSMPLWRELTRQRHGLQMAFAQLAL